MRDREGEDEETPEDDMARAGFTAHRCPNTTNSLYVSTCSHPSSRREKHAGDGAGHEKLDLK